MAIYQVNCPQCLEATLHEAEDDLAAAKQHGESSRHANVSQRNDILRAAGFSNKQINPKGPTRARSQEFTHGKDHNEEGN